MISNFSPVIPSGSRIMYCSASGGSRIFFTGRNFADGSIVSGGSVAGAAVSGGGTSAPAYAGLVLGMVEVGPDCHRLVVLGGHSKSEIDFQQEIHEKNAKNSISAKLCWRRFETLPWNCWCSKSKRWEMNKKQASRRYDLLLHRDADEGTRTITIKAICFTPYIGKNHNVQFSLAQATYFTQSY
ncbi:hypothetical protein LXL04_007754 [Taraxacum kok-saghyz]